MSNAAPPGAKATTTNKPVQDSPKALQRGLAPNPSEIISVDNFDDGDIMDLTGDDVEPPISKSAITPTVYQILKRAASSQGQHDKPSNDSDVMDLTGDEHSTPLSAKPMEGTLQQTVSQVKKRPAASPASGAGTAMVKRRKLAADAQGEGSESSQRRRLISSSQAKATGATNSSLARPQRQKTPRVSSSAQTKPPPSAPTTAYCSECEVKWRCSIGTLQPTRHWEHSRPNAKGSSKRAMDVIIATKLTGHANMENPKAGANVGIVAPFFGPDSKFNESFTKLASDKEISYVINVPHMTFIGVGQALKKMRLEVMPARKAIIAKALGLRLSDPNNHKDGMYKCRLVIGIHHPGALKEIQDNLFERIQKRKGKKHIMTADGKHRLAASPLFLFIHKQYVLLKDQWPGVAVRWRQTTDEELREAEVDVFVETLSKDDEMDEA